MPIFGGVSPFDWTQYSANTYLKLTTALYFVECTEALNDRFTISPQEKENSLKKFMKGYPINNKP